MAAGPGCERRGARGLQGEAELPEKLGAGAECEAGPERPPGPAGVEASCSAPLQGSPRRRAGGGRLQRAGRDGDEAAVVPRRSRRSFWARGC